MLSQVWGNNLAFLQSAIDSGVVPIRGASRRCRIFCGGDSPWLRRLSGVTTHWMAGSLFTYMTWCKSTATWLQQDVDRTTERDEQLLGLIAPGAKCRPMDIFGFEGASEAASPHTMCSAPSDFCRDAGHCLGTQIGQVCASQYYGLCSGYSSQVGLSRCTTGDGRARWGRDLVPSKGLEGPGPPPWG